MSDANSVALEFLDLFARFEFALKRAGILKDRKDAQANWAEYSKMLGDTFFEHVLRENIAPNLVARPPRQLLAKPLEWSLEVADPLSDVTSLMVLGVCRVRNNYVHGEKLRGGTGDNLARDTALIADAYAVLRTALGCISEVDQYIDMSRAE